MGFEIRAYQEDDYSEVMDISILAFEPIFTSFQSILGQNIFPILYPDWRKSQRDGIAKVMEEERYEVWVGELDGRLIAFLVIEYQQEDLTGEIQLLAVHPGFQMHGYGTEMNFFALQKMKERGMRLAVVATGGDAAHTPARKSYEKAGFVGLPLVRYYKEL